METLTKEITHTIGMKIVIPEPREDDTWSAPMISQIDDINDDGTVVFCDDDWIEHEIEVSRIQIYQP